MERRAVMQTFVNVLTSHYQQEVQDMLAASDPDQAYGLEVSIAEMAHHSCGAAAELLTNPLLSLDLFDVSLVEAQAQLLQMMPNSEQLSIKERAHVRIRGLPWAAGSAVGAAAAPDLGGVRSAHVGQLLCMRGTVLRASAVQMLETQRTYACRKCKHRFSVRADLESQILPRPTSCPTAHESGCKGKDFIEQPAERILTDYQEVRVQARAHSLAMGAMPASMTAILQDDLVDCCQPGDDINITAVVLRKWKPPAVGARCEVALVLLANHVALLNQRKCAVDLLPQEVAAFQGFWAHHEAAPLVGRNAVVASMCPQLHGMFEIKLALLLMLIGGLTRISETGMHIRSDIHMLLVGDPGTGKSQLMKYASQLSPRTVVASGTGSSAAGLTATAVREGPSWTLQAGALVLADGGLCCIDEFDGIKPADRATIHEAMEQQTISIAKAGLLTTLNTRASVFGVVNPKRKPGTSQADVAPTSLSGPLLSRFDMVLLLLDRKDAASDARIAAHILDSHQNAGRREQAPVLGWALGTLQKYIYWVKSSCAPVLQPAAERLLVRYYQLQRRGAERLKARTTIRMLESLVRLAQAHARLMARHEVTEQDAIVATALVKGAMQQSSELAFLGALTAGFDADPEATFANTRERLLGLFADDPVMR